MSDLARASYDGAAEAYERGRPSYPNDAIRALTRELGLRPETTVIDLGAGTGKMTRTLATTGACVIAIEPVEAMLSKLRDLSPTTEAHAASADSVPLPDGAADAVVAAQAFHWFADIRSLREIRRLLVDGGSLALLWNVRDLAHPFTAALSEILDPLRGRGPHYLTTPWREPFERKPWFRPLSLQRFPYVQSLSPEAVVERVASNGYVNVLPGDERRTILRRVSELSERVAQSSSDATVNLHYTTDVYVTTRLAGDRPSSDCA